MIGYERHVEALRREAAALAAVAREAALSSRVPACPEWDLHGLLAHVGHGFRVVAGIVRDHADAEVSFEELDAPAEGVVEWFEDSTAELVEALTNEPPDSPAWNWSPFDHTVGFWARRMAHEVAVHRWDGEAAVREPAPVDAEMAADGVDELLGVYLPTSLDERPSDVSGTASVEASDTGDRWFVRLRPDSSDVVRGTPASPADAVLRGTASDLLLAMWGRSVRIDVSGDPRVAAVLTE